MTDTTTIDRAADAEMRLGRSRMPEGPIWRLCSISGLETLAGRRAADDDELRALFRAGIACIAEPVGDLGRGDRDWLRAVRRRLDLLTQRY